MQPVRLLPWILVIACTTAPSADDDTDDTDTNDTDVEDTDAADTDPEGTGRLALRFTMDAFLQDAMPEGEEPIGTFDGTIFPADDVTVTGPIEGATSLEGVGVDLVDLVAANPSPVLFTSGPLPAGFVRILGFLDADGNADPEDPGPDNKDPVTLPEQNEFEVIAGSTTEVTVKFGLLNP